MTARSPYLSVVATSRNDDHGGNLLGRMQLFIDGFVEQCNQHHLDAELIIVEWNPPEDRARLLEALEWPSSTGHCDIRIIEVPKKLHMQFDHAQRLPLFQMIAKNVGIRRSRGKFVLATNIDILFSDELCHYLAMQKLDRRSMYRIDRYDVPPHLPPGAPFAAQLAYCRRNVIRLNTKEGTFAPRWGKFGKHARRLENAIRKWARLKVNNFRMRTAPQRILQMKRLLPPRLLRKVPSKPSHRATLHTNACGDFTLIARDRWFDLRAYAEFPMYSFHIDSLLCHAAYHSGINEVVLEDPMRIYHLEHSGGWSPEAARNRTLDSHLDSLGVPKLSDSELNDYAEQMGETAQPIIFNDEDWGLAGEELEEISIRRRLIS